LAEETDKTLEEVNGEGNESKATNLTEEKAEVSSPGESNETKIKLIEVSRINVPRERVTSVWSPDMETEFLNSIKAKGILKPLDVIDINGAYWLTDGLHRLLAAEKLAMLKVPCHIKKGSLEDLLIENIIMNRQRGKSNPAQEAETLSYLVTTRKYPLATAALQMGFSTPWAKKLLRLAGLPDEVKDLIKHGKLPVTGAFYIADLPTPQEKLSVARDASTYNYNAHQIKTRVAQLLNPDVTPHQGDYTFNSKGRPKRIPIRCRFCTEELPHVGKQYVWVCSKCEKLAAELIDGYNRALTQIPTPALESESQPGT
jgi:ParB/RepB/Spo0J family partition protein